MPYLNQCSLYNFFRYHSNDAEDVTFIDTADKVAFGLETERMFSLLELRDIVADEDNRFIALYAQKEKPADAANTDERKDG